MMREKASLNAKNNPSRLVLNIVGFSAYPRNQESTTSDGNITCASMMVNQKLYNY